MSTPSFAYRSHSSRPSFVRSKAALALALPLLLTGACKKANEEGAGPAASAAPPDPPIAVQAVEVVKQPMPRLLPLTGALQANQSSEVAADISGKILTTNVERGSFVDKGALLALVDRRSAALSSAEAQAAQTAARTQAAQAKADCDRNEQLFKEGAISQAEYDRQKSNCEVTVANALAAQVRVDTAKKGLGDTNIRAPFSGMVAERYVSAGEYVQPQTKVAQVVQIDPLRLELTVPESGVQLVREGLGVDFEVAAFPDQKFHGTIRYIGPALRAASRDLIVEAIVPNQDRRLRPGMFATAHLDLGDQVAPVIPKTAIRSDGSLNHVFVVKEGQVEERLAQLGEERAGLVVVEQGVAPGERVVAPLTDKVRDGVRVQ